MAEQTNGIELNGSVNIGVVVTGSEKAKNDLDNIDNQVKKKRTVKIDVEVDEKGQKRIDQSYIDRAKKLIEVQNQLEEAQKSRTAASGNESIQKNLDAEIRKLNEQIGLLKKKQKLLNPSSSAKSIVDDLQQTNTRQRSAEQYKKDVLARFSVDEIQGLASATGKLESYTAAVEKAKEKYQALTDFINRNDIDMSSKNNQTTAKKMADDLEKTLKVLKSEGFDSFNTKGSFVKSFSGNLADVRQEVTKLLSGYEEIDQATIKWAANQKSLTYLMEDSDGVMKKFRLNLEKTADGFNARTVELGKQTGFDKLGDMISNGFSAGANGITKVVDMYASVQDMINYAKQGIDVFKEYDAALTDISYTTEGTKEQISDMGKSYVQLAKDMSTSVEDSMKVASIYANLQTSSEEVMQSVKPTLLLANATGADASNASDQIQGILEQFDIGTDQAEHVVDVLENISSNLKEDFGKAINNVTEGVSAVGQTAADAGFTFEQLAAMIGKVSEKTRDSGSEIGNSLKTMLTRISKASSLTDEVDNETISKAAAALHEAGVEVYEQDGTFRNFLTILSELNEEWDTLSDAKKAKISYEVAATRQTNRFKVMMDSLTDSMQMAEDVTNNSDGYADSLQEKYEESFNGKLQKLKSTAEGFWIDFMDGANTSGILDFLTEVMEKLTQLTDAIGPLGTAITALSSTKLLSKILKGGNGGWDIGSKITSVVG